MQLFSTEQVSKYHPDKYADQISDAILDACLAEDKDSRVACECMVKGEMVILCGEITTKAKVNYAAAAQRVGAKLGYKVSQVFTNITEQSGEIAGGVKKGKDLRAGDRFVSKARAQFNVPDTDAALDRFCTGEYISIRNVDAYSLFPNAGFPWNEYLLEHYVAAYSEKYALLHIGFNANACVGAIVKKNTGYENIDDIVVRILADSDILLKKQAALQYLCDEGYIARRMYTNIEELLIRATAQRNRKEAN